MTEKKNGSKKPAAKAAPMKLAEALSRIADLKKRLSMVAHRAAQAARYQEGEPPVEDAAVLLTEALKLIDQIEDLTRRINLTNAATIHEGRTITTMLARRDALGKIAKIHRDVADAASPPHRDSYLGRQLRSELVEKTDLAVPTLRMTADRASEERRVLDVTIQQLNWATDLLD